MRRWSCENMKRLEVLLKAYERIEDHLRCVVLRFDLPLIHCKDIEKS